MVTKTSSASHEEPPKPINRQMISRTNDQPAFLKIDSTSTHIRYVVDDKSDAAQRLNRNTKIGPVRTNHRLPPPCSPVSANWLVDSTAGLLIIPTRARAGQRFWLPSSIFSYGSDIDQNSGMNAYFLQYQCSTWSLSHLFFLSLVSIGELLLTGYLLHFSCSA